MVGMRKIELDAARNLPCLHEPHEFPFELNGEIIHELIWILNENLHHSLMPFGHSMALHACEEKHN